MRRFALGLLFVAGCASPGADLFKKVHVDGGIDAPPESFTPDANVDAAPPDAMPPVDAAIATG